MLKIRRRKQRLQSQLGDKELKRSVLISGNSSWCTLICRREESGKEAEGEGARRGVNVEKFAACSGST